MGKKFNRLISKIRYKVEQGFGTLKRKFGFARASYRTVDKVKGQMTLQAMAFNLLKALNKNDIITKRITCLTYGRYVNIYSKNWNNDK